MHMLDKSASYDEAFTELMNRIGSLQSDIASIAGAIGAISGHGVNDLRESTRGRAKDMLRQGRRVADAAAHRTSEFEHSIEQTLRRRPVAAVAVAAAAAVLIYFAVRR